MSMRSLAFVAVALGVLVGQPVRVDAVGPDPNLRALVYNTNLVQAMDQCTFSITNVGGVAACTPSNSSTDGTHFTVGRVIIRAMTSRGQVATLLRSSKATPPAAFANKLVHTVIVLRVTRTTGTPLVTWVDQTLNCPNILVPPTGDAIQKATLLDCGLAAALADNTTNKEIVSVQVVDNASSKAIAVPGVRRLR